MKSIVPVGPFHPLQEEPEHFRLHVDGETVVGLDIEIGYNHRGIEKLAETKTWDQVVFLVERICGICSTSHPIASVQAMEDCGGIEVPERALYIRSIIGEMERLHSHLLWVGLAGHFLGYNTVFMWAWKHREVVLDLFERICGNRQHYAMMKPGGVRRDIPGSLVPEIAGAVDGLIPALDMYKGAVLDDPVLHSRLKGVGVLTAKDIHDYCALGPTARASGVAKDVRRDHPHAAYDKVDWKVVTHPDGDVFAKAVVRVLEMYESAGIIKQCLERMPAGEIDSDPRRIGPGEGIGHYEAPRGETFHYCRSDGTNRPVRYKVRAPTFMSLATDYTAVVGESITDATIILAAIDPCYCCTERTSAIDHRTGETVFTAKDLVRLSRERTERLRREYGAEEPAL
jgi:NADH-quinone oxidoreductase subunit D